MANELKPNAPGAVASLVLGIISICTGCIGVGIVLGIIGIVMAKKANRALAANPDDFKGNGVAKGGLITSIIGLVLSIVGIIYWIYVLVIAAAVVDTVSNSYYW